MVLEGNAELRALSGCAALGGFTLRPNAGSILHCSDAGLGPLHVLSHQHRPGCSGGAPHEAATAERPRRTGGAPPGVHGSHGAGADNAQPCLAQAGGREGSPVAGHAQAGWEGRAGGVPAEEGAAGERERGSAGAPRGGVGMGGRGGLEGSTVSRESLGMGMAQSGWGTAHGGDGGREGGWGEEKAVCCSAQVEISGAWPAMAAGEGREPGAASFRLMVRATCTCP